MPSTVAGVNYSVMFPLLFISILTFSLFLFSLYTIRRRRQFHHRESPSLITDIVRTLNCTNHSTISENLKSSDSNCKSPKKSGSPANGEDEYVQKKKRKKKKQSDCDNLSKNRVVKEKGKDDLYPFTSSSSATQRKIKQQYDQLVKSHDSNGLTLIQVGQFVNCLVEARDELKHKSEVIRRKFTITKALLFKADRSSFDRLRQQIYKLELEQKRVEEDASVYNWLQQQLKLSPAYEKMLEIGAKMESKPKSVEPTVDIDSDICDISFEELLAQEKKDYSFWQKKGKTRSGSA